MTGVRSADQAAREALGKARQAAHSGTFGVGALLVDDRTGEVLDTASNEVVRAVDSGSSAEEKGRRSTFMTHDPTAHGERELITRFFERRRGGAGAPGPDGLTIVSSLEPCAMCAGAILASGLKVGVIALDPVAGLGMVGGRNFGDLPEGLRESAEGSFGYYEIPGSRPFKGSARVAFGDDEKTRVVSPEVHDSCEEVFDDSLGQAMAVVSESGRSTHQKDPIDLPPKDPLRLALQERLPHFLSLRLDNYREANAELLALLELLSRQEPERGSAAALVDPFGNLIVASGGGTPEDPIATGFVEMIRTYSRTRFDLSTDSGLASPASKHLAHPKFGTLYRYPVPDPKSPSTLFELGAYGSTMEGPVPNHNGSNLQFLGKGINAKRSRAQLLSLVEAMPPFYSTTIGLDIKVSS